MSKDKPKKLPEFASTEEFAEFFETHDMGEYELEKCHFDYTKAKPNRFALRSPSLPKRDRLEEDAGSDCETGIEGRSLTTVSRP